MTARFWSILQTACLMAIVFRLYEDKWGEYGGPLALVGCIAWALFMELK